MSSRITNYKSFSLGSIARGIFPDNATKVVYVSKDDRKKTVISDEKPNGTFCSVQFDVPNHPQRSYRVTMQTLTRQSVHQVALRESHMASFQRAHSAYKNMDAGSWNNRK